MPYVERNGSNEIIALYGAIKPGVAEELLANGDAEVLAFRDPTLTLDGSKAAKQGAINALRDAKSQAGFTTQGKTWASDLSSVGSIMSKWHRHSASPPFDATWISTDNATVTLAWADFKLLSEALQDYLDALVNQARTHKDAILLLGDVASVNAHDITADWPNTGA